MHKLELSLSWIIVLFLLCVFGTTLFGIYLDHIEEMAPYICMDS